VLPIDESNISDGEIQSIFPPETGSFDNLTDHEIIATRGHLHDLDRSITALFLALPRL
jgi:hypothetical protein